MQDNISYSARVFLYKAPRDNIRVTAQTLFAFVFKSISPDMSDPIEETKQRRASFQQQKPKLLRPFNTSEVKILLLENINQTAIDAFKKQGYQVSKRYKECL
jgi:hypothetical protein